MPPKKNKNKNEMERTVTRLGALRVDANEETKQKTTSVEAQIQQLREQVEAQAVQMAAQTRRMEELVAEQTRRMEEQTRRMEEALARRNPSAGLQGTLQSVGSILEESASAKPETETDSPKYFEDIRQSHWGWLNVSKSQVNPPSVPFVVVPFAVVVLESKSFLSLYV